MFAHSLPACPRDQWEALDDHLRNVGDRAAEFAAPFGWEASARVAGVLHDIGKVSAAFQAYIRRSDDAAGRGPDHSTAGARVAEGLYPMPIRRMLAFAIAGHHAGLADGCEMARRLGADYSIEPYAGWEAFSGTLPLPEALVPTRDWKPDRANPGFSVSFLTRMLFSCLVDADFLETERFYGGAENASSRRGDFTDLKVLRDRLRMHMEGIRATASTTPVSTLRTQVLDHVVEKAALPAGLFTLTVPTGGGKTLASLSFALEHAILKGLRRVVYVIPFTSIIEQTADVFRAALTTSDDVLEHHSSFDWEKDNPSEESDDEGPGGLAKLRKAAENWDAPIVVTTAVQFFESLFANKTSRCRKLHNLARSVIVLDEAQTLPVPLLRPCMAALDELARNYGASIVLCTATQPALRCADGFKKEAGGFNIDDARELAPEPEKLYAALRRVKVEHAPEPVADADIARRFEQQEAMLCIVNSRAHARAIFELIGALPGAVHLSTLMCPVHRRMVLQDARARLKSGEPVRLVATSLIEAGVDIDFPEVWRAAAGIDSIAQAAGRCNREGKLDSGRVVVFVPAEAKPPRELLEFWQAAQPVLRNHDDVLGLDAVRDYFRELYWQKGHDKLDAKMVGKYRGVLAAIRERHKSADFPFRSIAEAFRLIDNVMEPVVVPFDDVARDLIRRIAAMKRPLVGDLRRLQQYTVSIPRRERDLWLGLGALRPLHPGLGDALLGFADCAHYRMKTGLDLRDIGTRDSVSNIFV